MKLSILGDTHGNTRWVVGAIPKIRKMGCTKILQVGDFGLWDHIAGGVEYLDAVNAELRKNDVILYAIGGNHENWDRWEYHLRNSPKDKHKFVFLRSHIRLAPRLHLWEWDNRKFASVAGGYSIDKKMRLESERIQGHRTLWWPQETITSEELDAWYVPQNKVDFLASHDCPDNTPFDHSILPILESKMHRQLIDRAVRMTNPKMHFHGHMHKKYEWVNSVGGNEVLTYGLSCDGMVSSHGVLDTKNDEFTFEPLYK